MSENQQRHRAESIVSAHIQAGFDVRCEWGLPGIKALAPTSDVVIVVDVLSFTTCVEVATANGAAILPYRFRDDSATDFATRSRALLASSRDGQGLLALARFPGRDSRRNAPSTAFTERRNNFTRRPGCPNDRRLLAQRDRRRTRRRTFWCPYLRDPVRREMAPWKPAPRIGGLARRRRRNRSLERLQVPGSDRSGEDVPCSRR